MSAAPITVAPIVVETEDKRVFQFPTEESARGFEDDVRKSGGATARLAIVPPPLARPMYDLEMHLASLLSTEDLVPAEQEEEFGRELQTALTATVEKRDRVGQFMAHLEMQIAFAETEIARLQKLRGFYATALERLSLYVTRVIEALGTDAKGKRKKLEGRTTVFGLHGCDKSVEITDEEAVPARYKRVTITLPAETWELLVDSLDFDLRASVLDAVTKPQVAVDKRAAKADLKAEVEVPGARLIGGYYLERK